jgi:hypothetical protein
LSPSVGWLLSVSNRNDIKETYEKSGYIVENQSLKYYIKRAGLSRGLFAQTKTKELKSFYMLDKITCENSIYQLIIAI